MSIKLWILALLAATVIGCADGKKQSGNGSNEGGTASTGLSFAFSTQALVSGNDPANSWCRVPFLEAAVISADPANSNRRLFALGNGPTKVFVEFGKFTAAFILRQQNNIVEIYTSDNFPECLSNKANFSIDPGGTTFHYNNNRYLDFEIQLLPMPNGIQIALEMAPGAGYGMEVRR